ncbi:antibiotic biosynthesis monooxygenase [Bosea sp. F3-2]|uniref:putative quinol monooxygenase n=1 Tax=Bosea sp. F3-2 TaxID=2599640 RepID=UPI0011EEED43|nr:putative quinol monooxygenase [Bosea sp. F3-2]QEL22915.1 antibiotic biosynthesis monooxygenase [Bosea sp. F3-2]
MSYVVIALTKVQPESRDDFVEKLKKHIELSRLEKGCLQFDVSISNEDQNEFVFFEQYVDEAAFLEHKSLERVKNHIASVSPFVEGGGWAKKLTKFSV